MERNCENCIYNDECTWPEKPDGACTAHTDKNGIWCCLE